MIVPKTPDSSKISHVSTQLSRDCYPLHSPYPFEKSPPGLNVPTDSMTEPPNPNFPKLSSIGEAILENDDYRNDFLTVLTRPTRTVLSRTLQTMSTVVNTEPSSPNPPQCAYRAHNETDPSKRLTYLNIQHPIPIKLEDFPMSPAAETVPTDEHCYSTSNNAPSNAPVSFYRADDPETLPVLSLNQNPL